MTSPIGTETLPRARRPGFGPGVLTALGLFLLFAALIDLAGRFRQPIIVDIGPSTGRYSSGFEDSEETPPTTSRWTRQTAAIDIPLDVDASLARFSVRAARYLDEPTRITVVMNGQPFAAFEQPRGRQRIQEIEAPLPEGPLNLELRSEDPNLGMALDWIRIDGARWRIPLREWTVWVAPPGIFAALLLSGASLLVAGGGGAVVAVVLAIVAALDPFGFVHCARDVSLPAILFSMIAALVFPGRSAVILAITATVLLKGGFLFHPNFFYNDVRQNDRLVGALRTYEGGLLERSIRAQVDLGVGYPRIIGGKKYAFPYSPVFYWPFTHLPADRDIIIRALKHTGLIGATLEVALAALLASRLSPAAVTAAAWLTFAFPIVTSRLLFAMWSTVVAHSLDLLMVLLAIRVVERPEDRRAWLRLFAAVLATLLSYVSSLFTVSAFLLVAAVMIARVRWHFAALWGVTISGIVFGLYGQFTYTFLTEILPAIVSGSGRMAVAGPSEDTGTLPAAFARIVLFGGYGFPLLALAGLGLVVRRRNEPASRVFLAYAVAFVSLVCLRGLSGGLFKDLKEVEFGGPAMTILGALALSQLDSPIARRLIIFGLVTSGLWMQYGHFERWSRLVLG